MHFLHLFRVIYLSLPAHFSAIVYPFEYVYRFLRCLRLDLWTVNGEERTSFLPLSALVALGPEEKSHLTGVLFGQSFRERYLGRTWYWNVGKLAKAAGSDHSLVVVKVEKPQYKSKAKGGYLVIPNWVSGEIQLPLDRKILRSTAVQSDRKRIRDHKLGFEITRDERHFETFYKEMHLPYMINVFGTAALIQPYEDVKQQFRNCELLLVKKEEESISGVILSYPNGGSRLWLLGVRDGDRSYLKMGALAAIYHFGLEYLQERGYSKVDLGWSRSFLKDGALLYKRKLGMRITRSHKKAMAVQVLSCNAATRSFLENNPFIIHDERGLDGAVFVDEESPITETELQQFERKYLHPGLGKLAVYRIPKAGAPLHAANPLQLPKGEQA